jgi:TusA-related sulfurtransferase
MKFYLYVAAIFSFISLIDARSGSKESIKTSPSIASHPQFQMGISPEPKDGWLSLVVFFNGEVINLYADPKSPVQNIVKYIASQTGHEESVLEVSVSYLKASDESTRKRKVKREIYTLSAPELRVSFKDFNRTIYTIKVLDAD